MIEDGRLKVREVIEAEAAALAVGCIDHALLAAIRAESLAITRLVPPDKHARWASNDRLHGLRIDACSNEVMSASPFPKRWAMPPAGRCSARPVLVRLRGGDDPLKARLVRDELETRCQRPSCSARRARRSCSSDMSSTGRSGAGAAMRIDILSSSGSSTSI